MNRIKEVLTHKGISQTCLAEKMDKSYANTHQYARNKRQPSFKDLYIISEILQVNAKNLLVNTENNTGK